MKKVLVLVLALAMVLGCTAAMADKIGYTCMDGTNPFFVALEGSIREVVEANGDELISLDPQNSNEKQLFLSLKNGTYTGALNHDATGNISVSLDANTVWQGTINSDNNTNTDADTVVVNGTWIMDGASYPDVLIINAGGKVYTNGYTLSYTSLTNNGTLNTTSTGVTGIDEVATKAKSTNGKVYRIDGTEVDENSMHSGIYIKDGKKIARF